MSAVDREPTQEEQSLAKQIEAKDNEIRELSAALDQQKRRNKMVESEFQLMSAAMHRAEDAHALELAKAEEQSLKSSQDDKDLLERLHQIKEAENAVRWLYVQMQER
jgi:hypothetical protein